MNNNEKKKKYLLYGIVAILFLLSTFIFKAAFNVSADDNNVTIKSARIAGIKTGTPGFDSSDGYTEDDDGNMTGHTAGADSSDSNRLVKSNDSITYNFGFSIGGIDGTTNYYSRVVKVTVNLSTEEAKYVSFEPNKAPGETTKEYTFDNISSTGGEYNKDITLYVINAPNDTLIAPKFSFIVDGSTSNTPIVLGKNDNGDLDYKYEDGRYKNTNRSTVTNYMPTVVSSVAGTVQYDLVYSNNEGQKALFDSKLGRFFTAVVRVFIPNTKGTNVADESLTLPVGVTGTGTETPTINENWVRLYNTNLVDTVEPVAVKAPYSIEGGSSANNQTRYPGSVSFSSSSMNITGFKIPVNGPSVGANSETLETDKKILGTYAISLFSPRAKADGKNNIGITLSVGSQTATFTNQYYEDSDYNLTSGFYDETGSDRLTTHVDQGSGSVINLDSSTSKGSTITYKTNFKYKKTGSDSGIKQVLKVDPLAFRVIPFSNKEDVIVKVNCGKQECENITKDNFEFKYITGDWTPDKYTIGEVDSRVSEENRSYATSQCANLASGLSSYSREQIMNIYGGPCITDNGAETFETINDARDEISDAEKPITKVIVQTKEGVNLPDDASVEIIVKLRVRNVNDITRSYQSAVVLSTSDTDSELYYYVPTIDENTTGNILNPNNYTRSTFQGTTVNLTSTQPYADSIRIVNFTARQDLTVTNTKADGSLKTSYEVDENDVIHFKLSTNIQDLNEQVGADDVWYIKSLQVYVDIPKQLDYIPDDSLGTPQVINNNNGTRLIYTLPWTKANFKIPDIYFDTKLSTNLTGSRVAITVNSNFNPININDEYDASVVQAKGSSFTIYGTQSTTVLLSQTNEGPTVVDRNSEFTYLLHAYNNSGKVADNYTFEDVLPYDGDTRGSKFSGSYEVKVTLPGTQPAATVTCSTADPKTFTGDINSTLDEFKECNATEEFVKATAIRINGINLAVGQKMDPIRVTVKPKDNKFSDKYYNSFRGEGNEMTSKESNKIKFSVINRRISGRVFYDSNEDGVRGEDEKFVEGLTATLYKVENGTLVETGKPVKTNKDGEYKFENLEPGFYRVRIEYDNNQYDLALRYGSENTATDSDAYKIRDGLAEISGKYVPNTMDGIDLTVFEKSNIEDMDMGLIPRQSFGFTMKKYITQVDLNYNNTLDSKKYNNESTVAINVRNTLNATAKVYYGIAITNTSTTAGYVKLVHEDIPEGLIFDGNDPYNAQWTIVNNELQSAAFENEVVEPGETKYLQIALSMPNRETGNTFINNVKADVEEYIPRELAKENEFTSDEYTIGNEVDYAGVSWNVINVVSYVSHEQALADLGVTEEEYNADTTVKDRVDGYVKDNHAVTLLAKSSSSNTTKANGSGDVYKWGNSPINAYLNSYETNGWLTQNSVNHSILYDQVVCNDASSLQNTSHGGLLESGCTSNDYVTTKVRLLNQEDYDRIKAVYSGQSSPSDLSWLYGSRDFWMMDAVDSTIYHDVYGRQTTSDNHTLDTSVNKLAKYVSKSSSNVATKDMTQTLEVRPVITVSSKNLIGN